MKLQYLNSVTVLITTDTTKVLCDPWLKDVGLIMEVGAIIQKLKKI